MSRANNFVERMAAGKEAAAHARHRGRAYGGKVRLHAKPSPQLTGWEFTRANARCRWQGVRIDALEGYQRVAYPERYEEIELF
jgi:hypothetical protein